MRKTIFLAAAALILCGCSAGRKPSVGLILRSGENPYFKAVEEGAMASAKDNNVSLTVGQVPDGDVSAQATMVRKFIDLKPDVLLLTPIGSTEIIPAVKEAQRAGIKVLAVDNALDRDAAKAQGLEIVPFVTVNNLQGAYMGAQAISRLVTRPADAVILCGNPLAQNNNARISGIMRSFAENKNIRLVAVATAGWNREKAYHVVSELYKKYPNISVIYATNDTMALGALDFVKKNSINGVRIGGFDAIPEAVEAVNNGGMAVTVDQVPYLIGYTSVSMARRMFDNAFVPELIEVSYKVIVKAEE